MNYSKEQERKINLIWDVWFDLNQKRKITFPDLVHNIEIPRNEKNKDDHSYLYAWGNPKEIQDRLNRHLAHGYNQMSALAYIGVMESGYGHIGIQRVLDWLIRSEDEKDFMMTWCNMIFKYVDKNHLRLTMKLYDDKQGKVDVRPIIQYTSYASGQLHFYPEAWTPDYDRKTGEIITPPFENGHALISFAHSELLRIYDLGLRIVTVSYEGQKIGR